MKNLSNKMMVIVCCCLVFIIGLVIGLVIHFSDAKNPKNLLELGNRFLNEQNYKEAAAAFEEAIGIDEKLIEGYAGLIEAYASLEYENSVFVTCETMIDVLASMNEEQRNTYIYYIEKVHTIIIDIQSENDELKEEIQDQLEDIIGKPTDDSVDSESISNNLKDKVMIELEDDNTDDNSDLNNEKTNDNLTNSDVNENDVSSSLGNSSDIFVYDSSQYSPVTIQVDCSNAGNEMEETYYLKNVVDSSGNTFQPVGGKEWKSVCVWMYPSPGIWLENGDSLLVAWGDMSFHYEDGSIYHVLIDDDRTGDISYLNNVSLCGDVIIVEPCKMNTASEVFPGGHEYSTETVYYIVNGGTFNYSEQYM